jgi:hypothetical protein
MALTCMKCNVPTQVSRICGTCSKNMEAESAKRAERVEAAAKNKKGKLTSKMALTCMKCNVPTQVSRICGTCSKNMEAESAKRAERVEAAAKKRKAEEEAAAKKRKEEEEAAEKKKASEKEAKKLRRHALFCRATGRMVSVEEYNCRHLIMERIRRHSHMFLLFVRLNKRMMKNGYRVKIQTKDFDIHVSECVLRKKVVLPLGKKNLEFISNDIRFILTVIGNTRRAPGVKENLGKIYCNRKNLSLKDVGRVTNLDPNDFFYTLFNNV